MSYDVIVFGGGNSIDVVRLCGARWVWVTR